MSQPYFCQYGNIILINDDDGELLKLMAYFLY